MLIVNIKLFYMNLKNCTKSFRFFFSFFLLQFSLYYLFFFFLAEFPYTIFERLGACFTNRLNTKNILNMNIEDNCTNTLKRLIKENGIPSVWKVSIFIIPYFAYYNCDLVPIFLHIIFNIKFIIRYGLLEMLKNYTISISYINISEQKPITSLKLLLEVQEVKIVS